MRHFNYTVNVLVKAYLNDELEHSVCSACAVGNIVANAIGTKPRRLAKPEQRTIGRHGFIQHIRFDNYLFENDEPVEWPEVFMTCGDEQVWGNRIIPQSTLNKIKATGYSIQELAKIEYAFETAPCGVSEDEWMFNGLMAVVDVLAEIHGVDLEVKESAKLLFVK